MKPNPNDRGVFDVGSPFVNDTFYSRSLEVISLETFGSLVESGKEPFTEYYEPYGLTTQEYRRDVASKEVIVTLRSGNGDIKSLPSSYILSIPKSSGEEYVKVSVVTQLPLMWSKTSYTHYLTTVGELTEQLLGVTPTDVDIVAIGDTVNKDSFDHNLIEAERKVIRDDGGNNFLVELAELRTQVAKLQSEVTILESYIIANQ